MTAQETKDYISGRLTVPLTEVSRIIESFNATIDLVTALNTDVIPTWTALLTFQTDGTDAGKYCKHPDSEGKVRIWETKIDDNTANEPPVDPGTSEDANWKEISPSAAAAIPEWKPGLYGEGLVIVYHNHSTAGRALYVLLEPTRPFTSENIETEIAEGKWASLGGGISSSLQRVVATSAHGFVLKNVLTLDNTGALVKVSDPSLNKFVGLVTEVINANLFRIHTAGYVTGLSGLTAGSVHYAQSDGTLSTTESAMPVLLADSTTSGYILASGASASSGIRSGDASEGAEGVYTLTLDPAITEYTDGAAFLIRFDISSINGVGEDTTLNINSLGAKSIRRYPGVRLIPGDINNVQHYFVTFNASSDHFQVHHLPFLPNSVTNKASYVDILGRFRIAEGSVYDPTDAAWTHTSNTNNGSEVARWNNSDSELLFRLLSDFVAEFGHDGAHLFEVPDGITNGNALFLVPTNQAQAYQFQDKSFNKIFTLKTTTGDAAVILHGLEKEFSEGFTVKTKQKTITTSTTAATQNVIDTIAVPDGWSIQLRIKHAVAVHSTGRMITCNSFASIGNRLSDTLSGTTESITTTYQSGPSTGGFNINYNDTSKEVEIRLLNETGTGRAFVTSIEYEYILSELP